MFSRARFLYLGIAILAAILTISYTSAKMSSDNMEQHPLFQNDPNIDESIEITFPNGKHVPLTKINKPHAVVHPTQHQEQQSEQPEQPEQPEHAKEEQPGLPKSQDDVYVYFPNGKSIPLARITKPHAVIHPTAHPTSSDNAGGLLHTSDHRPGSK